ncbi:MAG TPA: MDR family MFS transporter [Candidatus Paceibacterota bacterium]|nr:MDR family MFS transporter [Candidatus Paceibacterota bacterium]
MAEENVVRNGDDPMKWWVLGTVIFGTFLGRLDQTVVNLALPKIINDFAITVTDAGWIATAYILANAVFVPVWGKLGDTAGRKRIYIIGFIGFIIASALCGLAWNLTSMIIFRIIQGFAVSADYPTAMAIIAVTFHNMKERAQALGIWSSAFAAASVFGPLIGGPLIDNFNWRSVFLINIPLGLIGLFLAVKYIHESVGEKREARFDWWGSITLGAALFFLTLVLDQGQSWGWMSAKSLWSYLATVVFTMLFVYIEHREPEPIVDFKFFRISAFVNTLANNFIVFMGMIGSVFLIPIFAQTFLGYDATQTGYLFIPMAAALVIASPLGGSFTGKVQPRYIIMASTTVAALGMYLFSYLDPRSTAINIIIPLMVMAFGLGFGMAQRTNVIASVVPKDEIGEASAVLALARNIAGAFGVSVFGTILENATNSNVMNIARNSTLNVFTPTNYQQFIGLILLKADVSAYAVVFRAAALLVLVGAVGSFWIRAPKRHDHEEVVILE